jgi:DNA-directed RNA polymerase subunit M/transcription elongation factor TFIIS
MALRFSCAYCSSDVIVEWLEVGERAQCKVCKKESLIPENAVEIKSVLETRHQKLQKVAKKLKKQVSYITAKKVWNDILTEYYCSNCDYHTEWVNEKCNYCGAIFQQPDSENKENLNLICSACNSVQKHSTATFCINCGEALFTKKKVKVNECPTCKTHFEISDKFCDKDGNKLKIVEIEEGTENQVETVEPKVKQIKTNDAVTSDADEELPMNWYKFLTYVACPLGIIAMIVLILRLSDYVDDIVTFSFLFDGLLIGTLMFGLHNKTAWSWKLLLGLNILNSLFGRIEALVEWGPFVYLIFVIIVNAFTTFPNYIYFKKRKHLFVN